MMTLNRRVYWINIDVIYFSLRRFSIVPFLLVGAQVDVALLDS